jgi:hypothetical protein
LSQPSTRRWLTEAFVIVASILFAFTVDAWWDERQEDQAAAELARGLLDDLRRSLDDLEVVREGNSGKRDASIQARELLRSPTPLVSLDSITALLTSSGGTSRLTPVLRSYEQLVSTGLLRRLDPAVQDATADWIQQQEVAREYFERDLLDFRQIVAFPYWTGDPVSFEQMLATHSLNDVLDLGEPRFAHSWETLHRDRRLPDILVMFAVLSQSAIELYDRVEERGRRLEALLEERYGSGV